MTDSRERIRVLRQIEHGVLSNVEKVNGIVILLKELARSNEFAVAVAAAHCLRRIFSQLLDPAKNPQLPRGGRSSTAVGEKREAKAGETRKEKKKRKVIQGANDADSGGCGDGDGVPATGAAVLDGGQKAARTYQAWLEARYVDFLRALLGWVAEVDDFRLQGPALRTLMHFVEIEPSLYFSAANLVRPSSSAGVARMAARMSGEGTIWGGLFAKVMRAMMLGPCSMQPKLLKSLGEDFANVHDDIRYYLLANVTATARRALSDHKNSSSSKQESGGERSRLPADSPLRGYLGVSLAFRGRGAVADVDGSSTASAAASAVMDGDEANGARRSRDSPERHKKKRKGDKKQGVTRDVDNGNAAPVSTGNSRGDVPGENDSRGRADKREERMDLAEIGGRLAKVLMVVRMVEEQSDLTAFLLPVHLSLPSSLASRRSFTSVGGTVRGGVKEAAAGADRDASSSSSSESDSDEEKGDGKGKGGVLGAGSKGDKHKGRRGDASKRQAKEERLKGRGVTERALAIERLRYHKKAFGDAWLACLRLPLRPAVYRQVLLFLPGNVIPYMPSPVRLADFLTEAYDLGGVQAVLALDALFLLMQAHDLEYPDFYDSLYRLVTPTVMYAKYRARFFRMVDLCLSSSHVPAYVVAAFLKRFARASLQAPPSGALFTLALARKMIGRHPECISLISSNANAKARGTKVQSISADDTGGGSGGGGGGSATVDNGDSFVDEFDPASDTSKGANALKTSLWELAALQKHYHPSVATLARGFLQEAGKNRDAGEVFAAPSTLAGETYQSLFDQEMRRKTGKVPLAFRRPRGIFDDVPEEGGGVFASLKFSL